MPSYYEVGSTNFRCPGGNGFDLYPLFISSQVIDAFLEMPPNELCIANVYNSSPVGRELLVGRVGWEVIEPTQDILTKFKSTKSSDHENNEEMTWYGSQSHCLPHQARIVLEWIEKGHATHKKTGESLDIDFSEFSLAQDLKPLVEEIAHGAFGRYLEQSPPISMPVARQKLDEFMSHPRQGLDHSPL